MKKRFDEGWYKGTVIAQNREFSHVLYEDMDEEYMSDRELHVTAATYQQTAISGERGDQN